MNVIKIPRILLPDTEDMSAWAVNACDQFTSDYGYWSRVEELTAGKVSAYNLIFPEIYLKDNPSARIDKINKTMSEYLSSGVFKELEGFILVERRTQSGVRTGIVLAVDLEDYSFEAGANTLIRSTEGTILERIPPRVEIRKNAPIELPHIMLLYNDSENRVLNAVKRWQTLYDFDLNMDGGHIKGTLISNPEEVINCFYSLGGAREFLFAAGDGNHSLATAKTCWENIKNTLPQEQKKNHPARYALCEAVNIYDAALNFEPIHRLIKTDKEKLFAEGLKTFGGEKAYIVLHGEKFPIGFNDDIPEGIRRLDEYISRFIAEYGGEADYIHGDGELAAFTKDGGAGVILPAIKKDDFFRLIKTGGNLPRKTFSMGEGNEKRYYLEAKTIK